jgi:hypothetical protein
MIDIYQNAEAVRAWIGCETEAGDERIRDEVETIIAEYPAPNNNQVPIQLLLGDNNKGWDLMKILERIGEPPPYSDGIVRVTA